MTERPEERDSLALLADIEKRWARLRRALQPQADRDHLSFASWERLVNQHDADIAALEAEVKERETERAMWERAAKNGSDRILDLEAALTKQYVEDANTATTLKSRIKQMEEALREAHGILQYNLGDADPHVRAACDLMWAALSPSDTEEEA